MFTQTIDDIEIMTSTIKNNFGELKAYLSLVCDSRVDKDRIQHIRDPIYGTGMTARSSATRQTSEGNYGWMYFVTSFRDTYICKMNKFRELKEFRRTKGEPRSEEEARVLLRGGVLELPTFTDYLLGNFTI